MIIHSGLLRVSPESPEVRNASTILSRLSICFLRCCDVSSTTPSAELFGELVDIDPAQQLANRGRADVREECGVALFLRLLAKVEVLVFVEQLIRPDVLLPGSMTT